MPLSQYHAPDAEKDASTRLGWFREAVTEGKNYLENQPGFESLEKDLRMIAREFPELLNVNILNNTSIPSVQTGAAKSKISEIISTLSNFSPIWNHKASDEDYQSFGEILNKCTWAWWDKNNCAARIRECIQFSTIQRTGYIFPSWNPHLHGPYKGDVELKVGGPRDFLPLWLPKSNDIQQAYAGIICEEMPVTEAWQKWPLFRERIKPDRDISFWRKFWNVLTGAQVGIDSMMDGASEQKRRESTPSVMIFYAYVRDLSINLTRNSIPMGQPRTMWSYEVPPVGADLPTGLVNPSTGQDLTRKAEEKDCLLYPNRRLVIFTNDVILYDGPSYWFHGKCPAVKLTLDPYPWSYLGGSLVRDISSLEEENNRKLQTYANRSALRADPPVEADGQRISRTEGESLRVDLKTPGATTVVESGWDKGSATRTILPDARFYDISQWDLQTFDLNDKLMDTCLGLDNIRAISEMRGGQQPGGDTIEKLMQIKGSRTQTKGNIMERFCVDLGQIVFPLMLQFYDTKHRYTLFGYKGLVKQDFDLDPGTMIPDTLPGTDKLSSLNIGRYRRAKQFSGYFQVEIEPGSLLEITSMTRQLQMQLLWKDTRFPIDPVTLAEAMKLPNFGTLDDTPDMDTMVGRYKKWMAITAYGQGTMQGLSQQGMMQTTLPPQLQQAFAQFMQMLQMAQQAGGQPTGQAGNGQPPQPEGRPSSFNAPPQLEVKQNGDGTERVSNVTSR